MILDILNKIATTDSTKEKEAIIRSHENNELLKRVWKLAYSKRFNYGIKKWPEAIETRGIQTLESALDFIEHKLATRELSGQKAIDNLAMVIYDLNRAEDGDTEVLRRVMMRDLECGAGVTIGNKVWKGIIPEQPQMLASSYSDKAIANIKFPAFAQLKADGARCFAEVTDDGVTFYSRAGNEYQGLTKLSKQLFEMTKEARERHPSGVMIDGELVYHVQAEKPSENALDFMFGEPEELSKAKEYQTNVDRSTSNGLANKSLKGTISEAEANGMKFQVWDYVPLETVYCEDRTKPGFPYDVRFRALELMTEGFDQIILIENHIVHNLAEARAIYKTYVEQKLEGIILKNIGAYWENKRSKNLVKFKEVIDIALEVVGWYEHSKDPNKIGGVELMSSCKRITSDCGSGFTDTTRKKVKKVWIPIPLDQRDDLDREYLMQLAKDGKLIGMIADCECNGWVTSEGRKDGTVGIFLPIIKGWRFDKTKADSFVDVFGDWEQTGIK